MMKQYNDHANNTASCKQGQIAKLPYPFNCKEIPMSRFTLIKLRDKTALWVVTFRSLSLSKGTKNHHSKP